MHEYIKKKREGAVLVLTLTRKEKKNALTGAMYSALTDAMKEAQEDETCRVIMLCGQEGIFCAGNDLQDFLSASSEKAGGLTAVLGFLRMLVENEKPLMVAVDGAAIGIGTTLLLHADYVLASERAVFATPFVDLALVPEAGSSLLLPNLVGHRHAFELLVMGERWDAVRAYERGLINRIETSADLPRIALELAQRLAARPRDAVRLSRRLMRGDKTALLTRINEEVTVFHQQLQSQEAKQALEGFFARNNK